MFYSDKLDKHWDELDEFEGEAYQRVKIQAVLQGEGDEKNEEDKKEKIEVFIYVLK